MTKELSNFLQDLLSKGSSSQLATTSHYHPLPIFVWFKPKSFVADKFVLVDCHWQVSKTDLERLRTSPTSNFSENIHVISCQTSMFKIIPEESQYKLYGETSKSPVLPSWAPVRIATFTVSAMTSGPMPSPARTAMVLERPVRTTPWDHGFWRVKPCQPPQFLVELRSLEPV